LARDDQTAPGSVIDITDPGDTRLAPYHHLREAHLRQVQGLFIAEGPLVIERAQAAGYVAQSFLLAPRWVDQLQQTWQSAGAVVFRAPAELIEQITGFHVHRGALAAFQRGAGTSLDQVLLGRRLVVLEDVVDHANLGAIIRSAAALGWDGVVITAGSADPLYRRAIKTSMGAVFRLPWARLAAGIDVTYWLRRAGWRSVALALSPQADDLTLIAPGWAATDRLALLLGSEGPGLTADVINRADLVATIPMAAGVDSLNVAAAAAIACYALGPGRASSKLDSQ
jgi:tRNA G18 (ribose-2'-O)-methylase SpoU